MDDEQDEDDLTGEADSLPFIISQDLVDQYGAEFGVTRDEQGMYAVTPKDWKIAPFRQTRFSMGA